MEELTQFYARLLRIERPWIVIEVRFPDQERVDVYVDHERGIKLRCPRCDAWCPVYDHSPEREWRHLDTCDVPTYVHTRLPRVQCKVHGVLSIASEWAEPGSNLTRALEAHVIDLAKEASLQAVSRLTGLSWDRCCGVLDRAVRRGVGEVLLFRAGRSGEYGYQLVVPIDQRDALLDKLLTAGAGFEMVCASETARAQCVLENFFFDVNREGKYGLTPLELQLQWRLSPQKTGYPGAEAVRTRREAGWTHRLTCFAMSESSCPDQEITCDGETVGRILAAGYSPLRGEYVGKALLVCPYWHAGLDAFVVGRCPLRTISAPAINNLSLRVTPYRHSFHTREEDLG